VQCCCFWCVAEFGSKVNKLNILRNYSHRRRFVRLFTFFLRPTPVFCFVFFFPQWSACCLPFALRENKAYDNAGEAVEFICKSHFILGWLRFPFRRCCFCCCVQQINSFHALVCVCVCGVRACWFVCLFARLFFVIIVFVIIGCKFDKNCDNFKEFTKHNAQKATVDAGSCKVS